MYIPKEILGFIVGFITFPVISYAIYKLKRWDKEDGHDN